MLSEGLFIWVWGLSVFGVVWFGLFFVSPPKPEPGTLGDPELTIVVAKLIEQLLGL